MVYPDFATFADMARQGNLIPVYREILGDLETPVSAYKKLRGEGCSFLLESVEGGEKWGRFSFLGLNPSLMFQVEGGKTAIHRHGRKETLDPAADPFEHLRRLMAGFIPVATPGLPRFWGGLVGFLGYDMVRYIERLPNLTPPIAMPEARLMLADNLLIFDNLRQTIKILTLVHLDPAVPLQDQYDRAVAAIDVIEARLRQPVPLAEPLPPSARPPLTSNLTRERFEDMVRQGKEYIAAGDIIQVVLSQCFVTALRHDPFDLYRALRLINPSPYMFYLDQGDMKVVGASPEILVRLEDGQISYRPIAGTRPRGATPAEDQALEAELLADPKERAEHLMLVDLGRNDVGRVAKIGSVRVPELFASNATPTSCTSSPRWKGNWPRNTTASTCLSPPFPPAPWPGPPRSGPWRSSRSWSPPAGAPTPGRWVTSASAATWIFASPSEASPSTRARSISRWGPASWRIRTRPPSSKKR